jgi:hypothetical protein
MSEMGQTRKYSTRANDFRCSPNNGHRQDTSARPKGAKLGNGSRRKIALHSEPKAHFLLEPDRLSSRCPKAYLG